MDRLFWVVPNKSSTFLNLNAEEEIVGMEDHSDQSQVPFIQEDGSFSQRNHDSKRRHRYQKSDFWRNFLSRTLKLAILCLAFWGVEEGLRNFLNSRRHVYSISNKSSPSSVDPFICDCGASTQEAISQGCRFIEMAAAWLPPACIDTELSDEFDNAGPGPSGHWQYFSDPDREQEMSKEEVALLADTGTLFYSTWEWHVKHCTFQWRLDYRRRWLDTIVEPRYDHESHITHCESIIFADREKSVGSIVRLNSSNHEPVQHHEHGEHHVHD